LTEAEIRWLVRQEWAMSAEDIVWRRSKLGLRMNAAEIAALEELVQEILAETVPAESPA
jgi:glycerol-3-phosphate dehydrogenase